MSIVPEISSFHGELTAWRRDLHSHPELGFEEARTSELVASRLESFGIEVHRGVGRMGVVGVLKVGSSDRSVGLRADMDALPIEERSTFPHRSQNPGRMHACGHDGHTTMLLGAARYLAHTRRFDGTVNFVFQPAEEGRGGAEAMIADGLFTRFPCDSIFGMHNRPNFPVGHFAVRSGPMMAGGAFFDIDVTGKGTHAARPDAGVDPVVVAAQIVTTAQAIVSRRLHPVAPAVLSFTQVHAGDAYNVVPETAHLSGTARAFTRDVMQQLEDGLKQLCDSLPRAYGAEAKLDFRVIFPPTVNDPKEAKFAAEICEELVGADCVEREPPLILASEDFSYMLERVPGCYLNIGNGTGIGGCEVHNPEYDFNDDAIPLGASFFARLVERRLAPR